MESAIPSVLLCGLCFGLAFSQVLESQPLPCFLSCVCHPPALVSCNASLQFQLNVSEFNAFLHNKNVGRSSLVHIHTTEMYLPKFLPFLPVVQKLSLAENRIREVQNHVLPGMRLRELNLSHNVIEKVEAGAFQDLQRLELLDLSHNNLSALSKHVFSHLPSLQVLNLDFNQLMYFPFDAFSKVPQLRELTLNGNRLSYLMPGSLVSLRAVNFFSLSNNWMQSFVVDVVEEMPSLKHLDISGNPFHCGCALRGLRTLVNSSTVRLLDANQTTCTIPSSDHSRQVLNVGLHDCTVPNVTRRFDSRSVQYTADVEVTCDVDGNPEPAVLWATPWGHQFADSTHLARLEGECSSCRHQRRYKGIGFPLVSTVSVLDGGKKLRITNFRSFFNGNITCVAYNFVGNSTAVRHIQVHPGLLFHSIHRSMIMGGFCAAGFLFLGLTVGGIKLLVLACRKRFGKKKMVALTPASAVYTSEEDQSLTEDTHCNDDSFDFYDFYPPETPFTTPTAASPTISPRKIHTPIDGEDTPPGGWLPANILDTMEEVRWRLRYGVGRKMQTVKRNVQTLKESSIRNVQSIKESSIRNVQTLKESSIRNVQSIKESGSVYVHNIMESGSTAAHKVRASMVMGMETVKFGVQSIKEFCGTGDMGTQTISMISVETNLDTNETREVVRSITIV